MRNSLKALLLAIAALAFLPVSAGATALSDLTAATAGNTIDNTNHTQDWTWSTLTNNAGLDLSSLSTAATDNSNFLSAFVAGANSSSNVRTYTLSISNSHTGTNSSDYGIEVGASGGTHNYGIVSTISATSAGDYGIKGASDSGGGATYGVFGSNASSTGYAGYFNNTGGGYAAAFIGGSVGIGTATPQSLVHAYGGEVQVGSSGTSCASVNGGAIRFSGSALYYCDGTSTCKL